MNEALIGWLMTAPDAPELPTLEDLLARPQWMDAAACRGTGTRVFFAKGTVPASTRAICAGCAVREPCLDYAMADPELEGIWAGLTAKERDLRRSRVA